MPWHTYGMPAWLPAAFGLALFWGLVAFVLFLVFRRPSPADGGRDFSFGTDPADTARMENTDLPGVQDVSPRVREAWRAMSQQRQQGTAVPEPAEELDVEPEPVAPELELEPEFAAPALDGPPPAPPVRLPFAVRHRRLVAASRRLAARERGADPGR